MINSTCITEKADFKHEQEDHKSYNNVVLHNANNQLLIWTVIMLMLMIMKIKTLMIKIIKRIIIRRRIRIMLGGLVK